MLRLRKFYQTLLVNYHYKYQHSEKDKLDLSISIKTDLILQAKERVSENHYPQRNSLCVP